MRATRVDGWKQDTEVNPISLAKALRDALGLDLKEAHTLVTSFADAGELVLELTEEQYAALKQTAERHGIRIS